MEMVCKVDVSYIDDVIFCLEKLALDKEIKRNINIGPDEETTTLIDLAKMIANETRYNGDPIFTKPITRS